MTRHVMLNNVAHKDLRVITRYGAEFGDNVGTVITSHRVRRRAARVSDLLPEGSDRPASIVHRPARLCGRTRTCFSEKGVGTPRTFRASSRADRS